MKDAIEDLFSKENPDDDRPNVNVESVLELIESILDPIQKEAFELVKLRRKLQKRSSGICGR